MGGLHNIYIYPKELQFAVYGQFSPFICKSCQNRYFPGAMMDRCPGDRGGF